MKKKLLRIFLFIWVGHLLSLVPTYILMRKMVDGQYRVPQGFVENVLATIAFQFVLLVGSVFWYGKYVLIYGCTTTFIAVPVITIYLLTRKRKEG